jgi:hypothetical protein
MTRGRPRRGRLSCGEREAGMRTRIAQTRASVLIKKRLFRYCHDHSATTLYGLPVQKLLIGRRLLILTTLCDAAA